MRLDRLAALWPRRGVAGSGAATGRPARSLARQQRELLLLYLGSLAGVLLIVAKDDHRMRIEVGYGLEGALPDAIAKRIITETITPMFRSGAFDAGVTAGVEAILQVIQGEALPEIGRAHV